MAADLCTCTLDLVENDERTVSELAKGAGVNRHWLEKFKQRKFRNPGVRPVEKLYNHLTQGQLSQFLTKSSSGRSPLRAVRRAVP